MCTLSWLAEPAGYQLFLNRDERRTRGPERSPEILQRAELRCVAPRDGDFGGTWIAAGEQGLTLCLLNGNTSSDPSPSGERAMTSRGVLPLELIDAASAGEAFERLGRMDLRHFRPFLLVAFEPGDAPSLARWMNGDRGLRIERHVAPPLVSSSFCTDEVRRERQALYRRMSARASDPATEAHLAFHASHWPERGPHSPCMHRPDARTVSFCRVRVDDSSVAFYYAPDAPCRGLPERPALRLERVTASEARGRTLPRR